MDNNNTDKNKGLFKLILPILIVVVGVVGYFVYQGFFSGGDTLLDSSTNTYLSNTKLGKDVDIINKENLSFSVEIDEQLAREDYSRFKVVTPSQQVGRANPFLP